MPAIPENHPTLARVREIIPPSLHDVSWIAGSAACQYPLNADVDVWICAQNRDQQMEGFDLAHLPGNELTTLHDEEYAAGAVMVWAGEGIHIMNAVAEHRFPTAIRPILDQFDISCHAAAVNLVTRESAWASGYTVRAVRPLFTRNPQATVKRMFRFAERYNEWTFWEDPRSQEVVRIAFRMPPISWEEYRRIMPLIVMEGL